jgi:hypothetical protein
MPLAKVTMLQQTCVELTDARISHASRRHPYNEKFWLENYLIILDDSGYVIDKSGISYDDGEYASSIKLPTGTKGKVVVGYKAKSDVGSIKIYINDQYELNATIE